MRPFRIREKKSKCGFQWSELMIIIMIYYGVTSTVLSLMLICLFNSPHSVSRYYYGPHFIDEEIERKVKQIAWGHTPIGARILISIWSTYCPSHPQNGLGWVGEMASQWQMCAAWLVSQDCPEGWCSPGIALMWLLLGIAVSTVDCCHVSVVGSEQSRSLWMRSWREPPSTCFT